MPTVRARSTINYVKEVGGILNLVIMCVSFSRFFFKIIATSKYAFWGTLGFLSLSLTLPHHCPLQAALHA